MKCEFYLEALLYNRIALLQIYYGFTAVLYGTAAFSIIRNRDMIPRSIRPVW